MLSPIVQLSPLELQPVFGQKRVALTPAVNAIRNNPRGQCQRNRPIVQYSYLFRGVDRLNPFTVSGSLSSCTGIRTHESTT